MDNIKVDLKKTCKGEDGIYLASGRFLWRSRRDISSWEFLGRFDNCKHNIMAV
jgi:hypothetical protein